MANDIFKTGVAPIDYQKMLAVEPVYDVSKVVDTMSTQLSKDISDISRLQEQIEERKQAAIDAQNKKLQEAQLISDFNNYQDGLNKTITGLEAQVGRPLNDDERIRVYSTFQKQLVDGLKSVGRKDLAGEALVKYDPKMLYSFDQDKIIAQAEAVAQEAKAKKTNPFRYWIGDTAVHAVTGLSDMLANVEDIAGSVTGSETLKNIAKGGYESNQAIRDALLSDRAKQDAKDAQEAMAKAEAEGSIVGQALSYLEDPTAIIGNLIGSGGGAGLAVKGATKLGTKAIAKGLVKEATVKKGGAIGFGGLQGGGSVTRNQRETAIQDALNAGYTQEEADVIGDKAAEFNAQQAIGMAIGGLAGSSGAESLLFKKASDNALKTILKDGGAEAVTEALQSGQEQYAGNVASIDQGLIADDQAMRGVAGAAAGGGLVGALGGGAFGGLHALTSRTPNTNYLQQTVDPNERVDLRTSFAKSGINNQIKAKASEFGMTPEDFVVNAGIARDSGNGSLVVATDITKDVISKTIEDSDISKQFKEARDALSTIKSTIQSRPNDFSDFASDVKEISSSLQSYGQFLKNGVNGTGNSTHWDNAYVVSKISEIGALNQAVKSTLESIDKKRAILDDIGDVGDIKLDPKSVVGSLETFYKSNNNLTANNDVASAIQQVKNDVENQSGRTLDDAIKIVNDEAKRVIPNIYDTPSDTTVVTEQPTNKKQTDYIPSTKSTNIDNLQMNVVKYKGEIGTLIKNTDETATAFPYSVITKDGTQLDVSKDEVGSGDSVKIGILGIVSSDGTKLYVDSKGEKISYSDDKMVVTSAQGRKSRVYIEPYVVEAVALAKANNQGEDAVTNEPDVSDEMHIAVDDAIDAMDNLPKEPITVDVVVNRQTSKATTTQAELASWLVDEFTNSPNAESQIDELERQLAKVVREAGLSEKQRERATNRFLIDILTPWLNDPTKPLDFKQKENGNGQGNNNQSPIRPESGRTETTQGSTTISESASNSQQKVNTTTAPDRFEIAKQLKSAIDNGKVESTDELQRMINVLSNPNVNAHSDLVRKKVMQDATALLGKVNNTNDVHDTEWNEYVANGKVTDERVQAIADKVISGKTPTAKESQMVGSDDANKRFEAILTAERAKSNNTDDNTAKNADGNLNDWIVATFTRPKNDDGKDDSKHKVDEIPDDKKKTITEQEAKDKVEQSKDKEQKDGSVKYDKAILLSEYEKLIAKQKQDEQDKKDATEQPTDAIATDTENTDTATVPDATPVPDTTIEPVMPETATPVAPTVNTASKAKLVEVTDKINAKKSESSNKRKAVAPTKKVEPKVAPAKDERSEGKKDVEITEDIVSDIEAGLIFAIVKSGDKYDYIDVRDGFNDEDFSDKSWKLSPLKNIDTIDEADRFFVTQDGLNKIIDIASSKVKKQPPISDSLDDISKFAGVDKLEISDNLIKDGLISYLTNKYPNANKDSSDVVLKSIYNQIESLKNGGTSTGLEKLIKRRNALNLISKKTTVTPTVKENTDSKTKVGKAVEKFAPNLVKKSTPKASKTPKKTTVKVEQVAEVAPIQIDAVNESNNKKVTQEQKYQAESHAKDLGGVVVWQDGDIALIRGYSVLTGHPVYAVSKGSSRSKVDVESYTGDLITQEQKEKLISVKNEIETADAKKHADNPFIKFNKDGVAFSESIDPKIVGIITGWKNLLNLTPNVYFTTIDDARKNKDNFTGNHRAIASSALDANEKGSIRKIGDDYYIAFTQSTSPSKMLEVLAHEMGHLHERDTYDKAPADLKKKIKDEHAKFVEETNGGTARNLIDSLRARATGRATQTNENKLASELTPYWSSFSEWYADQVSRWAVSYKKPTNVVEQYFSRLGKALRNFYQTLRGQKFLPSETMGQYLDSVSKSVIITDDTAIAPTDTAVEQTQVENTARQNVDKAIEIIGTNDGNSILGDIINNKLDKEERDAIKNELEHENNLIIENDFGTPMKRSEFVNSKVIGELENPIEITNESTLFQKVIAKIADFIANSVKSIGAIIMSVAIANGVVSNDANANPVNIDTIVQNQQITNDANVVNSFVTKNKDNNRKKYIIADKKAGVMYVMNADGSLAITTPALFGKDVGDNATSGQTPAGKFKLKVITTKQGDVYGGAVQGFTKGSFGEVYAIHRVITSNAKERRIARLNSKTANDNRVSNGCINVPAKFYDENLNGNFDGNVYIIPETTSIDAMFGGVLFSRRRKDNAKKGTVKMVEDALTSMFGVKDIKDINNVNVIQSISEFGSASDIQKAVDNGQLSVIGENVGENFGNVQGFYDPKTDKITMIAENLNSADDARAVFLHEVGHRSMKKTIGAEKWNRLHRMVSNWKDAKAGSIENEVYIKAKRSADASGETGDRLKDELIQYAVEEAYRAGIEPDAKVFNEKTVAGFMASVWRAFTNAMKKLNPNFKGYLTGKDLVNIAYGVANLELKGNDNAIQKQSTSKNEEVTKQSQKDQDAEIVAQYAAEDGAPTEAQIREARQQIRDVEDKYSKELADGSWVNLTPTGKPSELTKGQWVQTRTDNFKKWFGDWENDPDNASKVINPKTGEPLVMYHGTQSDFNVPSTYNVSGGAIWLTPNPDTANTYTYAESTVNGGNKRYTDNGNVMPFYVKSDNVVTIKTDGQKWNGIKQDTEVVDGFLTNGKSLGTVSDILNKNTILQYDIWKDERVKTDHIADSFRQSENQPAVFFDRVYDAGNDENGIRANGNGEFISKGADYVLAVFNPNQIKSAVGNVGTFDNANNDIRFSMTRDEMLAYDGIAPKTKETILNSAKRKVGDSKDNLLKMAGAVVSKGDGLPKMTKLNMLLKGTRLLNEAWAFRVADMDSVVDWTKHLFNNLLAAYVRAIKTKGADVRAKIDDFHNAVGKYLSRADIKAQHDTLSELFVGATKENYDPSGTFKTKLGATKNAKLDALYNSLSEPAKQTYINTLKFFRNQFNRELVAFEQSLRDAGHEDAYIDKLLSEIRKIEVYVPLRQYGNRVMSVYVRNADGSNGETLAHEFFDGKINIAFTEMRMKAEFKKMFGDNINVTQITEFREKLRPSLSASQNDVIDAHAARLRQNGLSEEEVDYQISEFVKTLSSFGIAKLEQTKQERTGIYSSGFKRDIFRAINDVVSANEMRIASLVHNKTITDAFNAAQEHIKKESLNPDYDGLSADMALKAIRESFDYRASNDGLQGLVTKVNGFGFLATMGFDASQIPLQLSSLMNLALPHLVARFPKDKAFATKQMGKNFYAVLKMVRYGGMTEYLNMLSDKASNGDTQAKKLFDSLKPAYEQMRANDRVSFTDLKEIENEIYGKTNLYSNILRYSGMHLNITEQVVNMTIAMTTIQLAEKNGMNQSEIDFQVDEALRRGNPNSTPTTKGLWAKSAMGRFVTIMRSYGMAVFARQMSDLRTVWRLKGTGSTEFKEARNRLVSTIVIQGTMAGAVGMPTFLTLPLWTMLFVAKAMTADDDEEELTTDQWTRKIFYETFGSDATRVMRYGMLSFIGGDALAKRMSFDDLIVRNTDDDLNGDGIRDYLDDLTANAPLTGGVSTRALGAFSKFVNDIEAGRPMDDVFDELFRKNLPMKSINSIAKAYDAIQNDGQVYSKDNTPLLSENNKLNPLEIGAMLLGIRPAVVMEAQNNKWELISAKMEKEQQKKAMLDNYKIVYAQFKQGIADQDDVDDAKEMIDEYNAKNPLYEISAKSIANAQKKLTVNMENSIITPRNKTDKARNESIFNNNPWLDSEEDF